MPSQSKKKGTPQEKETAAEKESERECEK